MAYLGITKFRKRKFQNKIVVTEYKIQTQNSIKICDYRFKKRRVRV